MNHVVRHPRKCMINLPGVALLPDPGFWMAGNGTGANGGTASVPHRRYRNVARHPGGAGGLVPDAAPVSIESDVPQAQAHPSLFPHRSPVALFPDRPRARGASGNTPTHPRWLGAPPDTPRARTTAGAARAGAWRPASGGSADTGTPTGDAARSASTRPYQSPRFGWSRPGNAPLPGWTSIADFGPRENA